MPPCSSKGGKWQGNGISSCIPVGQHLPPCFHRLLNLWDGETDTIPQVLSPICHQTVQFTINIRTQQISCTHTYTNTHTHINVLKYHVYIHICLFIHFIYMICCSEMLILSYLILRRRHKAEYALQFHNFQ